MKTFGETLGELAGHDILHWRGDLDRADEDSASDHGLKARVGRWAAVMAGCSDGVVRERIENRVAGRSSPVNTRRCLTRSIRDPPMPFPPADNHSAFRTPPGRDRILVVGAPDRTLDLLRLAVIRSDDVVLVVAKPDAVALRVARRFAVETHERPFDDTDLEETVAVLVSLGDEEAENRIVRSARRHGVGVHVVDRPLVSDFTILGLLQQKSSTDMAA